MCVILGTLLSFLPVKELWRFETIFIFVYCFFQFKDVFLKLEDFFFSVKFDPFTTEGSVKMLQSNVLSGVT
ncbi:hypothetical protein FKM82_028383 [Ascaphus truei]